MAFHSLETQGIKNGTLRFEKYCCQENLWSLHSLIYYERHEYILEFLWNNLFCFYAIFSWQCYFLSDDAVHNFAGVRNFLFFFLFFFIIDWVGFQIIFERKRFKLEKFCNIRCALANRYRKRLHKPFTSGFIWRNFQLKWITLMKEDLEWKSKFAYVIRYYRDL